MICLHHLDHDGICSAAIVAKKFPECDRFWFMNYNFPLPKIRPNEKVIIVDFSLKLEQMKELLKITKDIIWIDHHDTAIKDLESIAKDIPGLRRNGTAACMLCWEYFFYHELIPTAVTLVADWDVWEFKYAETTKNFHEGLFIEHESEIPNSNFWTMLISPDNETKDVIANIIYNGSIIRRRKNESDLKDVKNLGFYTSFENYKKVLCVNARIYETQLIFDNPEYADIDFLIMFRYDGKRNKWKYELRSSKPEINVGEIAKKYGGGGHIQASGFESPTYLFDGV